MGEVLPTLVVIALGVMVLLAVQRGARAPWEASWVTFSFVAHVGAAFAQIWMTRGYFDGAGDMLAYHAHGGMLARVVHTDMGRYLPEVFNLIAQRPVDFPVAVMGEATGSMIGISTLASLLTGGSLYAMCVLFAIASFVGGWPLYLVFRESFPEHLHRRLMMTTMALPSVVFWTSGIVKEAVAVAGLGWLVFGAHRLASGRFGVGLVAAGVGVALVSPVKSYILVVFVVSAAVYFYWRRAVRRDGVVRIRPLYFLAFLGLAIGGVWATGEVFPRYAISHLVEETTTLQMVGARTRGGSTYSLGGTEQSAAAQLALAPYALFTALFRPLPFEASGFAALINTAETTFITGWLVSVIARERWREVWRRTKASPAMMFSLTFVVFFGVAVGLASTNLGTLSRYRAPLMPFFVSMIAVWSGGLPERAPARPRPGTTRPSRTPIRPRTPQPSQAQTQR